jgi:hypothetical protein
MKSLANMPVPLFKLLAVFKGYKMALKGQLSRHELTFLNQVAVSDQVEITSERAALSKPVLPGPGGFPSGHRFLPRRPPAVSMDRP